VLAERPASAAEIAAALGVNRSTGLRMLQELESLGFISRDPQTKNYRVLSERFAPMVSALRSDWREAIDAELERCRSETGESTMFAVPLDGRMVHVSFFDSTHGVAVREQIGTIRPMNTSAIGKAWLACLDDDELDDVLDTIDYTQGSERAARSRDELLPRVMRARQLGWATDLEETMLGAICVAAPAWVGDALVGAVGLSAPAARMQADAIARYGELLSERMRATRLATAALGP